MTRRPGIHQRLAREIFPTSHPIIDPRAHMPAITISAAKSTASANSTRIPPSTEANTFRHASSRRHFQLRRHLIVDGAGGLADHADEVSRRIPRASALRPQLASSVGPEVEGRSLLGLQKGRSRVQFSHPRTQAHHGAYEARPC
jgi:hypothetical protein